MARKTVAATNGIVADDNSVDGVTNGYGENVATENGNSGIDPDSAIEDDYARNPDGSIKYKSDGTPARKRGRKSGTGNNAGKRPGNSRASAAQDKQTLNGAVETLAMVIGGFHLALASFVKSPEMLLDDSETAALAKSVVNVMAQFDLSPDPRIVAVGGLIATATQIYAPRIWLIKERRKNEKPIDVPATNVTPASKVSAGGIDLNSFNFQG